ncbi:MAG: hypothetical protein KKH21_13710 [Gammaproteobacteria bacterium]|nr:hypothetical protein [Gammaproteobacteria bacterium]MBU0828111.1 hypothetical protein [Gammaproteobacteria bacterium]MBU0891921.1 hypothetical protein [Gammaproteobacteria bacterium]MBU1818666.1 hypothetical protein [Gammaproteobacteria bacterium]
MSEAGDQNEDSPEVAAMLDEYRELYRVYWNPAATQLRQLQKVFEIGLISTDVERAAYRQVVQTFVTNVNSIREFLSFPYTLAGFAAHAGYFREPAPADAPPLESTEFMRAIAKSMRRPEVAAGLKQMSRQAILLLWSAYETFSRDIFIAALNADAGLYAFVAESRFKEQFPASKFANLGVLQQHGYNISGRLGSILAEGRDFSSPKMLRELLCVLFQSTTQAEQLQKCHQDRALWLLGHRRHLIAHRLGIVDDQYIRDTGDSQPIGTPLHVNGDELLMAFLRVLEAAVITIACAVQVSFIRRGD